MSEKSKYLAVESIRGYACLMVVLSHLSLTFFPYLHAFNVKVDELRYPIQSLIHDLPIDFLFSGTSAVFIFFVLSGFILTKVALSSEHVVAKIFSMSLKRYPRLMFPALISCIISYLAFKLFNISSPYLSDWINAYGHFSPSLSGAIHSGIIDIFFGTGRSQYNPVLWTMKIELIGSFVVYLLCVNKVTYDSLYLLFFLLLIIFTSFLLRYISPEFCLGLISFLGGYLICIYGKKISNALSFCFIVIGLYLAGAHNDSISYLYIYKILGNATYQICNFLSGFLIVYSIIFNDKLNIIFSGKMGVFMGKMSFSVYLIHFPIISTFSIFIFNLIFSFCGFYSVSSIISSLLSVVFIYGCAFIFYNLVDFQGVKLSDFIANALISKIIN